MNNIGDDEKDHNINYRISGTELRKRAEKILKDSNRIQYLSKDTQSIIEELKIHQIELEIQNEEIQDAYNIIEESRKRYLFLYDFSPISYFTFDKFGLIAEVNLTGANLLGKEKTYLIKLPFVLFILDNYKNIFRSHLQNVFNTDTKQICELKIFDTKQNQLDVRLESIAVKDDKKIQFLTAVIDITELKKVENKLRKSHDELEIHIRERTTDLEKANEELRVDILKRERIEESLRLSEEKYRSIFEHVVEGIYRTKFDGSFITVNQSLANIFGYDSPEEFLSLITNVKQLYINPEYRDELIRMIQEKGVVTGFETRTYRKDRSIIWVSLNIKAVDKDITVLEGTVLDITDKKRSEDLNKALYSINIIINSTLDFDEIMRMVVVEANKAMGSDACKIIICNKDKWTIKYVHGLPQQIIGKKISVDDNLISSCITLKQPIAINDIINEDAIRDWIKKEYGVQSLLGSPLLIRDVIIGIIYFDYFSVKHSFSKSEIDFVEKLSTSVSLAIQNARLFEERKKTEEELRKRTTELARSNAELEQYAYVASHDLQAPLREISSFTKLLADHYKNKLDKDADEFINYILDGTDKMKNMIEDLLTYSRAGKADTLFGSTDLEDIFNQVLINLRTNIEENNAKIIHDSLPIVIADKTQMIQLFQNLIANAIKFKKKDQNPIVHVTYHKNVEWTFSIKDNGIGIDPKFMEERLFKLFQREHATSEYAGTGIGLAICKRIIERHRGKIWAESEKGKGSTFYFTLPTFAGA